MCGIVGIFHYRSAEAVDRGLLHRMNESLYHRGPDDGGLYVERSIGLGHRRLSIIDLAGGHQPLFNEDGSVAVVFNGEIYNYRELVPELAARGHHFRTRTDTEVIVHGWEQWGEACVERFRGMFAFAVWDRNRRTLFLARDRIGIKPLYYAVLPEGRLVFGSELKALLVHPGLPRAILPEAVEEFFGYGYIPEPRTLYRHAFKLPPGHTLTVRAGRPVGEPVEYWDLRFSGSGAAGEIAAASELRERLRDAVSSHLVSDVPVGAFLSGGVDSSAVVAMMAGESLEKVHTASISFGEAEFDESRYADEVARQYGTDHRVRQVNADDFSLVERLAELYDEPFADSSAMPTYRVCELARQGAKVVLSGDGGDETFGGYRRYLWYLREERVRGLLPLGLRRPVFGLLGRVYPKLDWAPRVLRAKATLQALAQDPVEGYFHSVSVVSEAQARLLFSREFRQALSGYRAIEVLRRHARQAPAHSLSRIQYLDFKTYLPGDILTKVDRASMAHALEVRVPILDHELVEWAASLSPELKIRRGEGKYLFKKALQPLLSNNILYRAKMGFAVPLAAWFRGPLRERARAALLGEALADTGWFNRRFLEHVIAEHTAGRRDYSALIWALMMFEQSYRGVGQTTAAPLHSVRAAGGAHG
ncbi:MAG: amidotransferase 1, exosortase A system-associated [Nitrococcus sp.]|nr:amidotransferase 1, exosortase A system-associated [Nitrococcus sp.]